ncbi:Gfo/Idh/MocA family protein [Telluribacter humicola]|uniref:Gfo/Idh/MocA family protein n=1 Tax=Telluribacter humicola TaxID=1720261 RepID=UPI001A95B1AC|nr:Gfo/Idh/MocA family oxidoreductase [Telluribacter humicola]
MENKNLEIGFLGVGWIGRNRMEAVAKTGIANITCIADPSVDNIEASKASAPEADFCSSYEELLGHQLDGIVIATPSALHASQSLDAIGSGRAVFCQKPLGRTTKETAAVVKAAREANLLLGIDFSYRYTCYRLLHNLVQKGELGKIYAIEMCFHNAYGPDKPWFYDPELSGGGCVIDLGVHLLDLALWTLGNPKVEVLSSVLFSKGEPLTNHDTKVEDFATALMQTEEGASLRLSCSWNLPAGKEAEIYFNVYGSQGGASFRNINGSFYEFEVARFYGTRTEILFAGPDEWGGRAIVDWTSKLAEGSGFDTDIESVEQVAEIMDKIYGRK